MTQWKEQFDKLLAKHEANIVIETSKDNQEPFRHVTRNNLKDFISELLEKLIADIPDEFESIAPRLQAWTNSDLTKLKQQLLKKWL